MGKTQEGERYHVFNWTNVELDRTFKGEIKISNFIQCSHILIHTICVYSILNFIYWLNILIYTIYHYSKLIMDCKQLIKQLNII